MTIHTKTRDDLDEALSSRMLRPEEVADILGVAVATLAQWRVRRYGPGFVRLGKGQRAPVRYPQSEVVEYVKGRQVYETEKTR